MFGALLGKQEGRNVEITNSFEVKWTLAEDNRVLIEEAFFRAREAQCTLPFPSLPNPSA